MLALDLQRGQPSMVPAAWQRSKESMFSLAATRLVSAIEQPRRQAMFHLAASWLVPAALSHGRLRRVRRIAGGSDTMRSGSR